MSPTLYQFRISYSVGRLAFTWVRSGTSAGKVRQLAKRALFEQYGHWAELGTVERVRA